MNMNEALDWAAKYAVDNKLFDAPLNARGYAVDRWTPPTPAEKLKIITDLANTVMSAPPSILDVSTVCAHGAIICAPCDHVPPSWRVFPLSAS